MKKAHPSAKYLVKYVAQLRAMRDHGWSIELLGKLAFGPDGIADQRSEEEKADVLALYREGFDSAGGSSC